MSDPFGFLDSHALASAFAAVARPGDVVAEWILIERLGAGKQGTVWLAIDRLERRVALKLLHDALAEGSRERERFEQLHERLEACAHPNVVAAIDHGHSPLGTWVAQELVPGGRSLHDVLEGKRRDEALDAAWYAKVVRVVRDLALGLAEIHRIGIVHGDVKPSNVLVTESGEPKLADFGLARLGRRDGRHSRLESFVGTLAYAAPELFLESTEAGVASDVYSLGVVLYELCTLQRPVAGHRPIDVVRSMVNSAVRPPHHFSATPEPLGRIAMRCLEREPRDRYGSVDEVADELGRVLAGLEPRTSRSRLWRRLLRRARNEWRSTLLVATSLALVGAGLALNAVVQRAAARERLEQLVRGHASGAFDPYWPRLGALAACRAQWLGTADPLARTILGGAFVPQPGAPPAWSIERNYSELARAVELATADGRAAWRAVAARLAADERFAGWTVSVEEDLVPLGPDPLSGLETFWHPPSGRRPGIGADGRVVADAATGLVFVLLPPGTFERGVGPDGLERLAARELFERAQDWRLYALFVDTDNPPRTVAVEPSFVSMFELTQGQWRRMTGESPSIFGAGTQQHGVGGTTVGFDERHPVENVSALEAEHVLRRFGMGLPSETLHEYAARAGGNSRWACGDDPSHPDLPRELNCQDEALMDFQPTRVYVGRMAEFDDGHVFHAPVGSFRPNRFGLHDMLGNVAEVCADDFAVDLGVHTDGAQAVRLDEPTTRRAVRGGHYGAPLRECSTFDRANVDEAGGSPQVGLRPVRAARRAGDGPW